MKKKLLCLVLVVFMMLPLVLSGCSDDEDVEEGTTIKPMTITLYGITGETTTEEAIQAVQDEINKYTEGKFNTHILLRLYPESEYYNILEKSLADIEKRIADEEAEAKRKKEEARALQKAGIKVTVHETSEAETTSAETYVEHGITKTIYPDEKGTQVDIFMVRGSEKLNLYCDKGYLASLNENLANNSKKIYNYIPSKLISMATLEGEANTDGIVEKGTVYGIPNNTVVGEYTYLLVNKAIAEEFYYSADDVSSLANLEYFLQDASENYPDYITLYNQPYVNLQYLTENESLIGAVVGNVANAFTRAIPRDLLNVSSYTNYLSFKYKWNKAGYITEGDQYALPEGEKVAAAFIKGDATLPEKYEDEYFVIKYANPTATSKERPGTMFCVSSFASNVDRCMEVILALETVGSFRDTFQYGVENKHYTVDEYTGVITMLNNDYSMRPEDTGNMFIMTPNTSMDETMKKLSADNWALAKQQSRDLIVSPYSQFNFRIITADNYKTESYAYAEMYAEALAAEKEKQGDSFDESKFEFNAKYPYEYTDVILSELEKLSAEYMQMIEDFEEYTDEDGNLVDIKTYCKQLRQQFDKNEWYKKLSDTDNPDSPLSQYNAWYSDNGPKQIM